jgi:hypothetical protein
MQLAGYQESHYQIWLLYSKLYSRDNIYDDSYTIMKSLSVGLRNLPHSDLDT